MYAFSSNVFSSFMVFQAYRCTYKSSTIIKGYSIKKWGGPRGIVFFKKSGSVPKEPCWRWKILIFTRDSPLFNGIALSTLCSTLYLYIFGTPFPCNFPLNYKGIQQLHFTDLLCTMMMGPYWLRWNDQKNKKTTLNIWHIKHLS